MIIPTLVDNEVIGALGVLAVLYGLVLLIIGLNTNGLLSS